MTARLFQFHTSPFCAKVRKILDYKGIDYEIVEVDYLERKELLTASGQIMVPALTLGNGDTIADSDRIAMRLEEVCPEPTIFPPGQRGLHIALARYIDTTVEDALFRVGVPDEVEYFRRQGAEREAMWRLIRERKYGEGFVDQMGTAREANWKIAAEYPRAIRRATRGRSRRISHWANRIGRFFTLRAAPSVGLHRRV